MKLLLLSPLFVLLLACETPYLTELVLINIEGEVHKNSELENKFKACVSATIQISSVENPEKETSLDTLNECQETDINADGSFKTSIHKSFQLEEGFTYKVVDFEIHNMSTDAYPVENSNLYRKNQYFEKHEKQVTQTGQLTTIDVSAKFFHNDHIVMKKLDKIQIKGTLVDATKWERSGKVCLDITQIASYTPFQYDIKNITKSYCSDDNLIIETGGIFDATFKEEVLVPANLHNPIQKIEIETNPFNDGVLVEGSNRVKTYYSSSSIEQNMESTNIFLSGNFEFKKEKIVSASFTKQEMANGCTQLTNSDAISLCMEHKIPPGVSKECAELPNGKEYGCISSYIVGEIF